MFCIFLTLVCTVINYFWCWIFDSIASKCCCFEKMAGWFNSINLNGPWRPILVQHNRHGRNALYTTSLLTIRLSYKIEKMICCYSIPNYSPIRGNCWGLGLGVIPGSYRQSLGLSQPALTDTTALSDGWCNYRKPQQSDIMSTTHWCTCMRNISPLAHSESPVAGYLIVSHDLHV